MADDLDDELDLGDEPGWFDPWEDRDVLHPAWWQEPEPPERPVITVEIPGVSW